MRNKGIANILSTLTHSWFATEFISNFPEVLEARLRQFIAMNTRVFPDVLGIYAETDIGPWLHVISVLCSILTGENDGGCNPRLYRKIAIVFKTSKFTSSPNYKRSILIEPGNIVAEEIIRFLTQIC